MNWFKKKITEICNTLLLLHAIKYKGCIVHTLSNHLISYELNSQNRETITKLAFKLNIFYQCGGQFSNGSKQKTSCFKQRTYCIKILNNTVESFRFCSLTVESISSRSNFPEHSKLKKCVEMFNFWQHMSMCCLAFYLL